MEITNNSRYYSIPLVVGRRVAQIVFFDTEGICTMSYERSGKYQPCTTDVKELEKRWTPYDMLPKMYKDKEITHGKLPREIHTFPSRNFNSLQQNCQL
jgi:hypothetical protein